MRTHIPFRLLVSTAALLAAACNDAAQLHEPHPAAPVARVPAAAPEAVPVRQDVGAAFAPGALAGDSLGSALLATATHWADGYLEIHSELSSPQVPGPTYSFNRSGRGTVLVTKPAGTTGRYVATFGGLSALLGSRSTVHVTGWAGFENACKPAAPSLVGDRVEIRCFTVGTGAPRDVTFGVLVTRNYADLAFAHAHLPTSTGYAPAEQSSWNPGGATTVTRTAVGQYRVTFANLAAQLPARVYGHVQVNAVGTSAAYCNPYNSVASGGQLSVDVRCFASRTGAPADERFNVLFVLPAEHLAYAWADKPTVASYAPLPYYSTNPTGNGIGITRSGVGIYDVRWADADREILDEGNVQVSAYGSNAQCSGSRNSLSGARVVCSAPNGAPMDSRFTVLLGS